MAKYDQLSRLLASYHVEVSSEQLARLDRKHEWTITKFIQINDATTTTELLVERGIVTKAEMNEVYLVWGTLMEALVRFVKNNPL